MYSNSTTQQVQVLKSSTAYMDQEIHRVAVPSGFVRDIDFLIREYISPF